ncbi:hypothetical protein CAPTEDRAFT_175082 [Capitella teleta]|uniref:C2H2-type domain-containing protein n=1 Tax=Capitella teleta TaxID=283909 RepID=R7TQ74_CAPTE|nr:hypothetical protein CAPTEDRAFT_175082 [Capitella teleta]|eukprot:ELT96053.1 hypothetical protein CAPTEDRAFT_175082 [Capitella teleta]
MECASAEKILICPFEGCSKSFTRNYRLDQHKRSHTKERPFVCGEEGCERSYSRQQHLTRHHSVKPVQRVRCYDYRFQCCNCEESFHKKFQLRHHQFTAHKGVLPFQCEICLKRFNQSSHLNVHKKKHQGFTCPESGCEQHFTKWSLLRKHKATEHKTGFSCNVCHKVFKLPSALKEHSSTHQGVAFACPHDGCPRSYTAKRNLNAHVRSVHQGKKFACTKDGCTAVLASKQKLTEHLQKMHSAAPSKPVKRKSRVLAATFSGLEYHASRPKGYMELITSESESETKGIKRVKLGAPLSDDAVRLNSESETKNETETCKDEVIFKKSETESKTYSKQSKDRSSRVTPQDMFNAMISSKACSTDNTSGSESETHLAQGFLSFISQRQRGSGSD